MQLKTIQNEGACRGRPPTRGVCRAGPMQVDGWQSAVGGLKYSVRSQKYGTWKQDPLWPHARDWPCFTYPGYKKKPPGGNNEIFVSRRLAVPGEGRSYAVKRRWGERFSVGDWRSVLPNLEPWDHGIMKRRILEPLAPHARDWPNITCSVIQSIKKNRDKDILNIHSEPALRGGEEGL